MENATRTCTVTSNDQITELFKFEALIYRAKMGVQY